MSLKNAFAGADLSLSIEALKRKVLDAAVRGELTEQLAEDGTAKDLLMQISDEKRRLIAEGKIKKEKALPAISDEEIPFEIPENWEWVRLGEIVQFINGDRGKNYPNKNEYVQSGIPWINTGHITQDGYLTSKDMNYISPEKFESLRGGKIMVGDLVFCLRGATFGKVARVNPYSNGAIASSLMIIRPCPKLYREYLYHYLKSPEAFNQLHNYDNGTAQPNLAGNSVSLFLFPLPPLAEQHRIVEKIEEAFHQLDELKKLQDAYSSNLDALKKKVIEEGIKGNLTDREAEDGTAAELLKEIEAEKQELIKAGKIKKEKPLPEITEEENPFEIPENWEWVRFRDIAQLLNGRAYKQTELLNSGKTPVLRVGNLFTNDKWYYSDLELDPDKYCESGDLIYAWSASFGPHIWSGEKSIYHYHIWKIPLSDNLDKKYVYYYLLFDCEKIKAVEHGVAMTHVTKESMEKRLFPLPPLAEQRRIVKKIEEVLALIK